MHQAGARPFAMLLCLVDLKDQINALRSQRQNRYDVVLGIG